MPRMPRMTLHRTTAIAAAAAGLALAAGVLTTGAEAPAGDPRADSVWGVAAPADPSPTPAPEFTTMDSVWG